MTKNQAVSMETVRHVRLCPQSIGKTPFITAAMRRHQLSRATGEPIDPRVDVSGAVDTLRQAGAGIVPTGGQAARSTYENGTSACRSAS